MKNKSGIIPIRDLVLVLPEEEVTVKEMMIQLPDNVKEKQLLHQIFGKVVAMGEGAFKYEEKQYGVMPSIKAGQRVMFARYGGMVVTGSDKVKYRLISDDDIVASVDDSVKYQVE